MLNSAKNAILTAKSQVLKQFYSLIVDEIPFLRVAKPRYIKS